MVQRQSAGRNDTVNVSRFRTQGTEGAGVIIPICIASCRQAVSVRTGGAGLRPGQSIS